MSPSSATTRLASVSRHLSTMSASSASSNSGGGGGTDKVLYHTIGGTRLYKLNRPKALNSLDADMIQSLAGQAKKWLTDDNVKLIIGKGDDRAFCAGGDVKTLVVDRSKSGHQPAIDFFAEEFELNWQLGRLGKPYVAVIDGFTMGGGAGIALPAQIRIATSRTVFAMPEVKIGYAPDVGTNYYLAQLEGEVGAFITVTGQEIWGRACYDLGIATHYVEPHALPDILNFLSNLQTPTYDLIASVLAPYNQPHAPKGAAPSSRESRDGPTPLTGEIRTFLDATFGLASIQEIYAALKDAEANHASPAVKAWAAEQRGYMDLRSPTGMAVALENYRRARAARRLDVALKNDMLMATGFNAKDRPTEDFSTGVTFVLVDKAKGRAAWDPKNITDEAVTPRRITHDFLNPQTPHLAGPELRFVPPAEQGSGADSTWGQFTRYHAA